MKEIKIYGSGCATCHKLKKCVETLVKEHKIAAEVAYSDDFSEMAKLGIMSVPAIMVDGKIKSSGTIPRSEEILKWLR